MTPPQNRDLRSRAFEIKFLVDSASGNRIREWARAQLEPDRHGAGAFRDQYLTSSLYFDTPEFDVFRRRGSYGRSKYRVRRYDGGPTVFLERKLRWETRLNKRRTLIALPDLPRIDGLNGEAAWDGTWFGRRLRVRRLQPVCQISYARTAREAMRETGRIRLTLDEGIYAVSRSMLAFSRDAGTVLVPDRVVLELKYHVTMPAIFKQLVEEFRLTPGPVSKYRFAVQALGLSAADPADAGPAVGATYA